MSRLGLKSRLIENDYDKLIAATLTAMYESEQIVATFNGLDAPDKIFEANLVNIYTMLTQRPVIIMGKRKYYRKLKKKFKLTNLVFKRKLKTGTNYTNISEIFNKKCRELYPNEVPYIVAREIGEAFYINKGEENGN